MLWGMVYPANFFRLVIGGTLYSETWNTSLSVFGLPNQASDGTILASLASVVSGWFASTGTTGPTFNSNVKLTHIKFNRIGPDGTYVDPVSQTHIYPTPVAGGGTATAVAPQLAVVASLRTAFERGRASKGRMYLPPAAGYVNPSGTDGRAATADAVRIATSVATLINSVNAAMVTWNGGSTGGNVAVMSNVGAGAWHSVTEVRAGRVVDTMRSRRSSLEEDYQNSTVAIS